MQSSVQPRTPTLSIHTRALATVQIRDTASCWHEAIRARSKKQSHQRFSLQTSLVMA